MPKTREAGLTTASAVFGAAPAIRYAFEMVAEHTSRRTKADIVYEALQNAIMSGVVEAGEHLRQEEVAERFGVSQTPVREAFRRLETEGLVEHAPNRGVVVRGMPWAPPPTPLQALAQRWAELIDDPDAIPGSDWP